MKIQVLLPILLLTTLFPTPREMKPPKDDFVAVSLVQLIATPEAFDGKLVSVIGFLRLDSEDSRLYLAESDYLHNIPYNGVWVEMTITSRTFEKIDSTYVHVVGTFRAHS